MIRPIPLAFCWEEKTVDLSRKMPGVASPGNIHLQELRVDQLAAMKKYFQVSQVRLGAGDVGRMAKNSGRKC